MNRETPAASRVRYLVVFVTMLAAVLLYLDRFCIAFAELFIKEELGLTDGEIGFIFSAFFATYALAQVPSGWLSDRFGARLMLPVYILLWSLFTGLTSLATGFVVLFGLRLGIGLGQAGAYPTSGGLLSKWVPFSRRAMASSVIAFGGRIGGFAAQVATAYLIVLFVPAEVSSLLKPGDLMDVPRFCYRIDPPADGQAAATVPPEPASTAEPLGIRVVGLLSPAGRQTVRDFAAAHSAALEQARTRSKNEDGSTTELRLETTNDPAHRLVAELNEILKRRDFFRDADRNQFDLAHEAKQFAKIPPGERSQQQVERLNRLLLEAAYPKDVKKVYGFGWRRVMWLFGASGLIVAAAFWLCCRDRPAEHPRCNVAELELIERGRPASAPGPVGEVRTLPWRLLLQSRSLWLSCISQFGTNVGWIFLGTWLPRYLHDVHHLPVLTRGWAAAIPMFVGWFGMLSGGWLTDRLTRALGLRWGRGLPMAATRFVAAAAFLVCLLPVSPWQATAALALVAFATDLGVPAVWAFMQDVGGRYVGSILGWGNMWGNFGAVLAPVIVGRIIEKYASWNGAFLICAGAFLISGLAALGVDATIPIAHEDGGRTTTGLDP